MTDKILTKIHNTQGELAIGCISLHKPKALNALDLDMVQAIQKQLNKWRNDQNIGAIFIDSEGDKAFCAGGDIVSMYQAMLEQKQQDPNALPPFLAQFFEQEYRLDFSIHSFPKPVICWGNGVIMGGGLGIFAGASHRIVTESARVAMPEITIGLFPDVGASYFLHKMPAGVGKFLGLTGVNINAIDCVRIGIANAHIAHAKKAAFLDALQSLKNMSEQSINALILDFHKAELRCEPFVSLDGNLASIMEALAPLQNIDDVPQINQFLFALQAQFPDEKVVSKAIAGYREGSPITALLLIEQLKRGQDLSLAECLQMELSMAFQCGIGREFQEGVRALLIEKDRLAKWTYRTHDEVPPALINAHFTFFDEHKRPNPLQSLTTEQGEDRV